MRRHYLFIILLLLLSPNYILAQELSATVTIQSNKVDNQVDPKIFIQLQTQLRDFINQRKWALDAFGNEEKINAVSLSLSSPSCLQVYMMLN